MMQSVLIERSMTLDAIAWGKKVPSCAVTFGQFAGNLVGREPFSDSLDVLHVPFLGLVKVLLAGAGKPGKAMTATAAKVSQGAAWPVLEDGDGKSSPAGVPHIAGGAVPLELEHGVNTWESDGIKVIGKAVTDGRL